MLLTAQKSRDKLLEALRCLTPVMMRRLAQLKKQADRDRQRSDLIWYLLLSSATTLGNAAGFDRLFNNRQLAESVSFSVLRKLKPSARQKRLLTTLKKAGVRYAAKKSEQLAANFQQIQDRGGVESETKRALSLEGRETKRNYFLGFAGIGPKYANNVWMDIYDPDFRECVAVDARLASVFRELGLDDSVDCHQFFRELAREANLEAWEVDRLLFWFNDYFIAAIRW